MNQSLTHELLLRDFTSFILKEDDCMSNKGLAYIYLTITVSAWGSLYVVSKFVLGHVPTFTILFLRYLVAGIALLLILRTREPEKIERQDYKYIVMIGFVGYFLSVAAQLLGTKLSNVSLASLINSMNPVFIILFAVPVLKEKITVSKLISVTAAVAGAYIIIGGVGNGGAMIGIIVSIFSVLTWSLMTVLVRRVTQKYDALVVTTYSILVALACTLPVLIYELLTTPHVQLFDPATISSILYMGLVCTALSHVLWNKSLSMIEAGSCSLFYPLQPMVAVSLGGLFSGEKMSITFLMGAVLIIGGVLFSVLAGRRRNYEKSL